MAADSKGFFFQRSIRYIVNVSALELRSGEKAGLVANRQILRGNIVQDCGFADPSLKVDSCGAAGLQGAIDLTFVSWLNCLSWTGLIPGVVYQISKSERRA